MKETFKLFHRPNFQNWLSFFPPSDKNYLEVPGEDQVDTCISKGTEKEDKFYQERFLFPNFRFFTVCKPLEEIGGLGIIEGSVGFLNFSKVAFLFL